MNVYRFSFLLSKSIELIYYLLFRCGYWHLTVVIDKKMELDRVFEAITTTISVDCYRVSMLQEKKREPGKRKERNGIGLLLLRRCAQVDQKRPHRHHAEPVRRPDDLAPADPHHAGQALLPSRRRKSPSAGCCRYRRVTFLNKKTNKQTNKQTNKKGNVRRVRSDAALDAAGVVRVDGRRRTAPVPPGLRRVRPAEARLDAALRRLGLRRRRPHRGRHRRRGPAEPRRRRRRRLRRRRELLAGRRLLHLGLRRTRRRRPLGSVFFLVRFSLSIDGLSNCWWTQLVVADERGHDRGGGALVVAAEEERAARPGR